MRTKVFLLTVHVMFQILFVRTKAEVSMRQCVDGCLRLQNNTQNLIACDFDSSNRVYWTISDRSNNLAVSIVCYHSMTGNCPLSAESFYATMDVSSSSSLTIDPRVYPGDLTGFNVMCYLSSLGSTPGVASCTIQFSSCPNAETTTKVPTTSPTSTISYSTTTHSQTTTSTYTTTSPATSASPTTSTVTTPSPTSTPPATSSAATSKASTTSSTSPSTSTPTSSKLTSRPTTTQHIAPNMRASDSSAKQTSTGAQGAGAGNQDTHNPATVPVAATAGGVAAAVVALAVIIFVVRKKTVKRL